MRIAESFATLAEAWSAAVIAGEATDVQTAVDGMTEAGILASSDALAALRREVDAVFVAVAGGIADRSRPELGSQGLARKTGHRSPVKLIAAATGAHAGDAARLVQVGQATRERATFSGHRAPSRHPIITDAIAHARISVDAAAAIGAMLDRVAFRTTAERLEKAERMLVEQAALLSLHELLAVIRRAEAWLDPDGVEPKIDELRAARTLTIREDASGMFVVSGKLDPETAAPIKAAIDGMVTHQLRVHRGENRPDASAEGQGGSVVGETRTLPQLQADALSVLCRHSLGCDSSGLPLATTTVIVRVPLEALISGIGTATIDGIVQPIDAGTARRMAANAEIIPFVLGADSEVLDCGRAKRAFTRTQRLVLEERDGGCASCGLPGRFTEAHHLQWWSAGGTTDLRNGILLCTSCHHRVHNDGWEIRIDVPPGGDPVAGTVWFIPPASIDPERRPRIGGRRRFDWMLAA